MCSALPTLRDALEHHVLEEVGEAGLARDLVLRADVVPDVDRDDGREVVLGDDQAEAVGEALVGEGHGRDAGHRLGRLLGGVGSPIVGPTRGIRWIDGVDMSIFRLLDIRLTRPSRRRRRRWQPDRQSGDPRGDPRMCRRARSSATSPAAASRTGSTGTSGPRSTSSSPCRATPARRRTCPRRTEQWRLDSLKSLHADIQTGVQDLFESELAIHTGILLVDLPAIRTSADFVDLVAETSPHDLLNALFTDDYHDDDLNQLLSRAIDGDQSAAKELSGKLPDWQKKGRLALVKDAAGTHRRILAVLQAWQGKFSEIEPRVAAILERDYDGRAANATGSDRPT